METQRINSDVLFWKAHVHRVSTQKINLGVNAGQIGYQPSCSRVSDTDPLALGTPRCLQEGETPGG